jgi:AcrR family transcriptional regulator
MPRTLDPAAYAAKRDALLDAAGALVERDGFERLKRAGMSRGALYHYFSSKEELLAALIERRLDRWEVAVRAAADRHDVPPRERLQSILRVLASQKQQDRTFLVDALRSIYAPENAALYVRLRVGGAVRFLPILTEALRTARDEVALDIVDTEASAHLLLSLLQECTDRIAHILLDIADGRAKADDLDRAVDAYTLAIHRTFDAPPGSLAFIESAELRSWAAAAQAAGAVR